MNDSILETLERIWGYSSLRPQQEQAIRAVLERRDSLVVMPTGGGKSICYQLPPLVRDELTVVVSPLISLMKDQVDTLRELGVEARQVNSTSSFAEKKEATELARNGQLRMLFVSPERLASERLQEFLHRIDVRTFAIDEAHCISHWGHDFRPEYRQLGELRRKFPSANIHAYTATATPQVRADIAQELNLLEPAVVIGSFDRANLSYKVLPKRERLRQTLEVIEQHKDEAGIVYCIRKKDVDELTAALQARGIDARPYHAGLSSEMRIRTQDAFAREECNLVVATVAFGMGIDRSNIRYVLHTGLPKSLEHYQQETGRAGRDGLEADCVLLYSAADTLLWKSILQRSAAESEMDDEHLRASLRQVDEIDRYARGAVCRHRALVRYFGEEYPRPSCAACDICLGHVEEVPEATVVAQKILSCVVRVQQRFGAGHVISVLRGETSERISQLRHDRLTTYGILADHPQPDLRDWIYQLIGHGLLVQEGDRYPVLHVTDQGRALLRGEGSVRLVQIAKKEKRRKSKVETFEWEGVDRDLFEALRTMRRLMASERGVPSYVILNDRSLRDIARVKPKSLSELRPIYGIGEKKLADLGAVILRTVGENVDSTQ
ncbi:MAG TPA: DNA helicase RecQ [Thermoanaerobaculia bacterium]|nr:DNA helicase RecQ [Thermoanaerobaculia bacterium]